VKALREGQYVKHFQYGFGIVTESDPERTSIDFDAHGLKKFVTSIMVVELAGDAPERPARSKRARKPRAKKPVEAAAVAAK
jgi:hypothetical protein